MNVTQVADRLLAELAPVDPEAAQAFGRRTRRRDAGPGAARLRAARRRTPRALAALATATVADEEERVLMAVMEERLASEIALDESGFTRALLAPLATPVHQVREVFDNLPHETPGDWERVADHLALVPSALQAYAETLREAAARGHVVAARQVTVMADQCERWVDPARDDFYRRLVAQAPDRGSLASLADGASPPRSSSRASCAASCWRRRR